MNIVSRLDRNRFEPAVCVSKKGGKMDQEVEALGIPFLEAAFTIPARPYLSLARRVHQAAVPFKQFDFDIWHSWHYVDDYTEPLIARRSGAKAWVYTKKNMSWGSRAWMLRSLLASRIGVDNTEMENAFFKPFGLKKKIRYIPHGIPTDEYSPRLPCQLGIRSRLGIEKDAVVVGCVANLTVRKGHHVLLEALSRVPGVSLVTIGRPMEQDYIERLERMRQDLSLTGRTHFPGFVENVPAFLNEIDIFVLPTLDRGSKEGCPVALVEAMSCGRACIATLIPGSRDIIEDEVSGLLVPAEDVDALANAIRKLADDASLRTSFGSSARQRILSRFSVEQEVSGYEAMYQEIMERKKI